MGLVDAPCDKAEFLEEVEFQENRPLPADAVAAIPVTSAVLVVIVSVLVLNTVSTTALKTVVLLRTDVARVVRVAIGTTHSIAPVC